MFQQSINVDTKISYSLQMDASPSDGLRWSLTVWVACYETGMHIRMFRAP